MYHKTFFPVNPRTIFRSIIDNNNIIIFIMQESWSFLRLAIRKWVVHDLPANTEVGLVSANDSLANRLHGLSRLQTPEARDQVASNIPYSTGDSRQPACLACALKEAIQVINLANVTFHRTKSPKTKNIYLSIVFYLCRCWKLAQAIVVPPVRSS